MALEIRITKKLPFDVRGPKTVWIIYLDYWGKNSNKCQLLARCLTHGAIVTFYGGRAVGNEQKHKGGFTVSPGIQEKLACAMVAQGCAEIVRPLYAERGPSAYSHYPQPLPGEQFLRR